MNKTKRKPRLPLKQEIESLFKARESFSGKFCCCSTRSSTASTVPASG